MTTPPAQAAGYPVNPFVEGNLAIVDVPGGTGVYGNLSVQGAFAVAGSYITGVPGADPTGASDSTTAILAAIARLPVGGQIELAPGTYLVGTPGAYTPQVPGYAFVLPPGSIVRGPREAAEPSSFRDVQVPAPAIIKVANNANLNAVFTDAAYSAGAAVSNPVPSSSIQIAGVAIDCNSANQTSGLGHAIALITQASSIVNNDIRNTRGHGILLTDTSAAGNTTTGGVPGALNENNVRGNRIYNPGGRGIYIASQGSLGTDGYLLQNVVDGNFLNGDWAIVVDQGSDWTVGNNHVYALAQNGIFVNRAANADVFRNFVDNYGWLGAAATTYIGLQVQPAPFGATDVYANRIGSKQVGATSYNGVVNAGAGIYQDYVINPSGGGQHNQVYFAGNRSRQISAGTGSWTPYVWSSGAAMAMLGVTSPLLATPAATGFPTVSTPNLSGGNFTFPDYHGPLTTFTQAAVTPSTASTSLVMAGLAVAFTPQVSGKVRFWFSCGAGTQTAVANIGVGARYGTGTAPVNGAAVTGTLIGSDQAVRSPVITVDTSAAVSGGGVASGLTPGTAYWFDLAYDTSVGADVAQIGHISIIIEEVPL